MQYCLPFRLIHQTIYADRCADFDGDDLFFDRIRRDILRPARGQRNKRIAGGMAGFSSEYFLHANTLISFYSFLLK